MEKPQYIDWIIEEAGILIKDIVELLSLTSGSVDFTESDIVARYKSMMDSFIDYLRLNDLIQP